MIFLSFTRLPRTAAAHWLVPYLLFLLFLGAGEPHVFAQDIPMGAWRTHLTYYDARTMVQAGERLYVASTNGFFFFDLATQQMTTLSKEDGLSDLNITALGYYAQKNMVIVGYANGNLDLLTDEEVINIRTIRNTLTFPDKTIRHIAVHDGVAYLSLPFGVVVVDLNAARVQESYLDIGQNGTPNGVYTAAVGQDSLFLATDQGLWVASLARQVNRRDFRNWRAAVVGNGIRHVAATAQAVFYTADQDGLYRYAQGRQQRARIVEGLRYDGLSAAREGVLLLTEGTVYLFNDALFIDLKTNEQIPQPRAAVLLPDDTFWIADRTKGLVKAAKDAPLESFFPSGPLATTFRLRTVEGEVLALAGGIDDASGTPFRRAAGFYRFQQGIWQNFSATQVANALPFPAATDLTSVAATAERVYFGALGQGLFAWSKADDNFTPLPNAPLAANANGERAVGGLANDAQGNLWVSNYGVAAGSPSVHRLTPDGTWRSFAFGGTASRFPRELLADDFGQVWVRLADSNARGLLVFEDAQRWRILGEGVGNGSLPSAQVNCLAKDRSGSMWVGTDRGVAEFFAPFAVLQGGDGSEATLPRFEGLPLLRDERVTAIAIDGGNRKWLGTDNGAWLFSPDGGRLLHHFTAENSPLLANQVLDIAIDPRSGEVFFATELGIASYRSDATAATQVNQQVKIFPNPVRPEFQGLITISGLVQDAVVKITDTSGKLIWETRAQGGTATWNRLDYNGRRAKTGIYLVFTASREGEQAFVGKLAIVD